MGTTASLAYMWYMGETVEFVYDGSYWQMVRGHAADTTYYGVTKLTNTISNSTTMALTPKAVYDFVEEGTWTPTVTGTSTYGSRRGWYSKVGDVVTIGWAVKRHVFYFHNYFHDFYNHRLAVYQWRLFCLWRRVLFIIAG